jgi:hypothetical protein
MAIYRRPMEPDQLHTYFNIYLTVYFLILLAARNASHLHCSSNVCLHFAVQIAKDTYDVRDSVYLVHLMFCISLNFRLID